MVAQESSSHHGSQGTKIKEEDSQYPLQSHETGVLDPKPRLLGFHMPDLATNS
jgi:hypothetical protein